MSIIRELQEGLRETFERELMNDSDYCKAEERLHLFIESELPHEKLDEIEGMIIDTNNTIFHAALEIGMKYGARLTMELLK